MIVWNTSCKATVIVDKIYVGAPAEAPGVYVDNNLVSNMGAAESHWESEVTIRPGDDILVGEVLTDTEHWENLGAMQ